MKNHSSHNRRILRTLLRRLERTKNDLISLEKRHNQAIEDLALLGQRVILARQELTIDQAGVEVARDLVSTQTPQKSSSDTAGDNHGDPLYLAPVIRKTGRDEMEKRKNLVRVIISKVNNPIRISVLTALLEDELRTKVSNSQIRTILKNINVQYTSYEAGHVAVDKNQPFTQFLSYERFAKKDWK